MSRPLMHPLKETGSLTRVQPGRWERVQRPDQLLEIQRVEHVDATRRPGISSIPSPWARLQLFRDAILDGGHPSHDDIVNDVLDALEIVVFQRSLDGVQLQAKSIDLRALEQAARAERKDGVENFLQTLRELAPDTRGTGQVASLTFVSNSGRLLFATSPFTLFFTPEDVRAELPGYFIRGRAIRALVDRPPALTHYVSERLLPQLGAAGDLAELRALRTILSRQASEAGVVGSDSAVVFVDANLHPADGIGLHCADGPVGQSPLTLRPSRTATVTGPLPLVLVNSDSPGQRQYFSWLSRPNGMKVEPAQSRSVLPGTNWKVEWLSPDFDFLTEKLVVLDSPLFGDRVHTAGGVKESDNHVLLPLTPKFFEYFRAEDVPRMLSLRFSGSDADRRVHVTLKVPTGQGDVVVEKEFADPFRIGAAFSVWPSFIAAEAPAWHDYYLVTYVDGQDVGDALTVEVSVGGRSLTPDTFQRDVSTLIQHFDNAPECIFIRAKARTIGDERVAAGVMLPKLTTAPPATIDPWTVAIDFGTSNTVVAYAEGNAKRTLDISAGTRFDLTKTPEGSRHIGDSLDSFFFPTPLAGGPFGTVVLRHRTTDVSSRTASIPAVTANVPFSGHVSIGQAVPGARHSNEIVGDLKWGGGGRDSDRLTKLFLHQVLQLVYAEARARGVRTEGMSVRWSYPSAFSMRKQSGMANRWGALITEFERERMRATPAVLDAVIAGRPNISRDESLASLLYLRTDPAAHRNFTTVSSYLKLTADVGGGTTDVAGYANSKVIFRNSILFGGRDLIGDEEAPVADGLFGRLSGWARSRGLPPLVSRVLDAYPTAHTKFTYLVRHPWFAEQRGALVDEPWFIDAQCAILYFYAGIHYNIGLSLRGRQTEDVHAPDYLFFGGNGSGYLNWLASFEDWNGSRSRPVFTAFFQTMLEAGLGTPIAHPLTVLTSSRPKQEVALGLLESDPDLAAEQAAKEPPVGEDVHFSDSAEGTSQHAAHESLTSARVRDAGVPGLRFNKTFAEREIAMFNHAFHTNLEVVSQVDPEWREVARRVAEIVARLDERFFDTQVRRSLAEHLERDDIGSVTLFVLEAAATLRELDRQLMHR